ncbi:MAG: biotin--[acetyl-CoA-carboxylase] ligase [Candidatus Alcyoniella australis]|nr:biotin--[acetyl-CoA-carboxylase] ligase [Candidatus Alcyoniella australis]
MSWAAALNLLEREDTLSGEQLGELLGVSRAAVHKGVTRLRREGYRIEGTAGRGYRLLESASPYCQIEIERRLLKAGSNLPVVFRRECDSTNSLALSLEPSQDCVVVADSQRAGHGRRGRDWVSPAGCNIYLTRLFERRLNAQSASELVLVAGAACAAALNSLPGIQVGLKWPNDIYAQGAKLAGILVEGALVETSLVRAAVGIGINVNIDRRELTRRIDRPATSLLELTGRCIARGELVAQIVLQLDKWYAQWLKAGLSKVLSIYSKLDVIKDNVIEVDLADRTLEARSEGIDQQGRLLVVTMDGEQLCLNSGEVTIRPATGVIDAAGS